MQTSSRKMIALRRKIEIRQLRAEFRAKSSPRHSLAAESTRHHRRIHVKHSSVQVRSYLVLALDAVHARCFKWKAPMAVREYSESVASGG